jgi:four helix bundle protein
MAAPGSALDRANALKKRTKDFAVRVFRLCEALPSNPRSRTIADQLLRSSSSVAANYRAVCRARSRAEFISKIGVVVEEADETVFWLEFLSDVGIVPAERLESLLAEGNAILAIMAASQRTARE